MVNKIDKNTTVLEKQAYAVKSDIARFQRHNNALVYI